MPLDKKAGYYERFHYMLVLAHDTLRSGMDQIIKCAPDVPASDVHNFIGYIQVFVAHFESHHHIEEHIIFPAVTPKIPIDRFIEEHRSLVVLLQKLSEHLKKVNDKDVPYEPAKIIDLITQISDLIHPHLKNEEDVFSAQALKENFTIKELDKISDQIIEEAKKEGATTGLPFMLLHLPSEDRNLMIYSTMPWLVKSFLVPVFVWWNKGYWKYAKYQSL